ncbi:hypothetical protein QTG54_009260, partial [Skeletonema marinoi]
VKEALLPPACSLHFAAPATATYLPPTSYGNGLVSGLFIIMQGCVEGSSATGSKHSSNKSQDDKPTNQRQPEQSNPTVAHKIINITAESLSQPQEGAVSIVDPWVPRIAHNDGYLQQGLDFSIGPRNGGGSADTQDDALKDTIISPFVGDIGAKRLGSALSNNNLLLYLNLSNNRIGIEGGIELARALYNDGNQSRTALQRLNLSSNCISDDGAAAFKEALMYNDTLEELCISDNEMGINGVVALLEGLQHNDAIKIMILCNNLHSLVDKEMERLIENTCDVLRKNSTGLNGGRLEVLEMGNGANSDLFDDGLSDIHSRNLIQAMSYFDAQNMKQLVNHRFMRLTLPASRIMHGHTNNKMARLLGFNSFYRPIIELYDIIRTNNMEKDAIVSHKAIPTHLQRDAETGALIGLLPSTSSDHHSCGISYKLLPRAMAFATTKCTLETFFNLIRYRPDMFFSVDSSRVVGCSPNGCCIL